MSGFFPVDRDIFTSSLWITGSPEERLLWLWLLGHRDEDGIVRHRELAIADGAKLPREAVEAGLLKFAQPDPDSRTRDHEGRRIERTPDGFVRILNHAVYHAKDYSTPRWRRWRERQRANALANAPTPLATNNTNTDTNTEETDMSGRSATSAAPAARGAVDRLFEHWRTAMQKPAAKLSPKRERLIRARLKEFTEDQLIAAVNGCKGSAFHMGENDRAQRYDSIELIFRSTEKVEAFLELAGQTQATTSGPPDNIEAYKRELAARRFAAAGAR